MNLSKLDSAYIAGFIDGDGSIYVQLKPNSSYRYKFQIIAYVVLYQSAKKIEFFKEIEKLTNCGYIRIRKDGIIEYIFGKVDDVEFLLKDIQPYLRLKKEQAALMLDILKSKRDIKNAKDFLNIAKKIDRFYLMNYSKKRKNDAKYVESILRKEKLLTP